MSRSLVLLGSLIAIMPLAVEVPAGSDSASAPPLPGMTRVQVAAGYGYYAFVARGCEGQILDHVPAHVRDGSVSVEHSFEGSRFRAGVRGGWLRDRFGSSSSDPGSGLIAPENATYYNRYLNPYVEIDDGGAAFGIGWVIHQNEFITASESSRPDDRHPLNDISAHARFGRERKYFLISWMEGMPVATDGGYLALGLGVQDPADRRGGFIGLGGGGPLEGAGPMLRANAEVVRDVRVELKLRAGFSGSINTGSAALGLEYRIRR